MAPSNPTAALRRFAATALVCALLASASTNSTSGGCVTYPGGYSLRVAGKSCPSEAPVSCGAGEQMRCCPGGLVCAGDHSDGSAGDSGDYCCPPGEFPPAWSHQPRPAAPPGRVVQRRGTLHLTRMR